MITIIKQNFETGKGHQLYLDERTLWRLACEWNGQNPHIAPGNIVHLTDDNPFVSAWQEVVRLRGAS